MKNTYRPWDTPEMRVKVDLIHAIEETLHINWTTLDLDFKRLYTILGGIIRPTSFSRWLNTPNMIYSTSPDTAIDLILDGRIEEVIQFASKYYENSFR